MTAEYMIAREAALAAVPDDLPAEEAGPFMCAGVTVFNALRHCGTPGMQWLSWNRCLRTFGSSVCQANGFRNDRSRPGFLRFRTKLKPPGHASMKTEVGDSLQRGIIDAHRQVHPKN